VVYISVCYYDHQPKQPGFGIDLMSNAILANQTMNMLGQLDMAEMRQQASEASELLKCLANENRLLIMCALSEGELSVGDLNKRVPLSQSALSQHLAVLRHQGMVDTRRESQSIYYSLANTDALKVVGVLHEIFC